jgi:hypothetical protein
MKQAPYISIDTCSCKFVTTGFVKHKNLYYDAASIESWAGLTVAPPSDHKDNN